MKHIFQLFLLQTLFFNVNAQIKKEIVKIEQQSITNDEKAAIKKMLSINGSVISARPGFHFVKANQVVMLQNDEGFDEGKVLCYCEKSNGTCDLVTDGKTITCLGGHLPNMCVTCRLPRMDIKGKIIPLDAVFSRTASQ